MDEFIREASEQSGYSRAKYLFGDLQHALVNELEETGISADHILNIDYFQRKAEKHISFGRIALN